MMSGSEAANLARWVAPLDAARDVLLQESWGCVERMKKAWPHLEPLDPMDLPSPLRAEWFQLSGRAARLHVVVGDQPTMAQMDEAGDIGSILLCFDWLLRRSLTPAADYSVRAPDVVELRPDVAQPVASEFRRLAM